MQGARYDGLDVIRAAAMLLGIVYHSTFPWMPDIAPWYFVADPSTVPQTVLIAGLLHAFRMQLFFALSGFFSHLLYERRGPRGFLLDRAKRLLVPLLVVLPLIILFDDWIRIVAQRDGLMSAKYLTGTDVRVSPMHLWFLIYLFVFCVIAWALPKWNGPERLVHRALKVAPSLLVLAIPTGIGLYFHPENRPAIALWPVPYEAFHFGLFFAFGWWLWPNRESLGSLRRDAWWMTLSGFVLGWYIFRGHLQWEDNGHVLAGLVAWLVTLGTIGLAFSMKSAPRPWLRFLVDSSYWVYLSHYPFVLALQLAFAMVALNGWFELSATVLLTWLASMLTFVVLVWKTPLGPWLGVKPMRELSATSQAD